MYTSLLSLSVTLSLRRSGDPILRGSNLPGSLRRPGLLAVALGALPLAQAGEPELESRSPGAAGRLGGAAHQCGALPEGFAPSERRADEDRRPPHLRRRPNRAEGP